MVRLPKTHSLMRPMAYDGEFKTIAIGEAKTNPPYFFQANYKDRTYVKVNNKLIMMEVISNA